MTAPNVDSVLQRGPHVLAVVVHSARRKGIGRGSATAAACARHGDTRRPRTLTRHPRTVEELCKMERPKAPGGREGGSAGREGRTEVTMVSMYASIAIHV